MGETTNFFETSRNETKTISDSIEKLATQVSRMEEKLLNEQQEEKEPTVTKPPPKMDGGQVQVGKQVARQPDAPLLSADAAMEAAARVRYAPPEPLPGSFSPRFPGWFNDGRWGSALYQEGIPCAGISLEKKEVPSIDEKSVERDVKEEFEEDELEEESDEEANRIAFVTSIRDMIRETSREKLENKLKSLPGVFSVDVELDDENKTLANGVSVNIALLLDEEFEPILEILRRDERYDEQDIIRNLETITKFVEEIKIGNRSIEEISREEDFNNCIKAMKGERENAGLQDPT